MGFPPSYNSPLKETLARQSVGDRVSATVIVSGPSRRKWIQRVEPSHLITIGIIGSALFVLIAVVGVVWQWRETPAIRTVTSQPPQTTGSPFPSPPAATTVQWNQVFGISRAVDLVFALFLDGKGPDFQSIKLKDAFLESGITGEVIKMKVGSTNPLDNTFPISEASLIPPKGFIRLVAVMNPLSPDQGLPNKEFLDNWRTVWFNAIYEDEKPDRILFNEKVMGSYFPELSGPHVTRRPDVKKD